MTFQVAQVTKPLCAVSKICEKGHTTAFDEDGSYIKNKKTGKVTHLKKERGVYVMDAAVVNQGNWMGNNNEPHLASAEQREGKCRGFHRPAKEEQ